MDRFPAERGSRSRCARTGHTERLTDAGIDPSVATVGHSDDNALAESVIGLFKTEVINALGPWRAFRDVERRTVKWIDWQDIGMIWTSMRKKARWSSISMADP